MCYRLDGVKMASIKNVVAKRKARGKKCPVCRSFQEYPVEKLRFTNRVVQCAKCGNYRLKEWFEE